MNRMWQQPMNGSEDRTTTAIMCDVVPSPPSRPALLHWERTGTRDTKQKKKVTTLQSLLPQLFSLLLLLLDTPHSNRNNKTKKKKNNWKSSKYRSHEKHCRSHAWSPTKWSGSERTRRKENHMSGMDLDVDTKWTCSLLSVFFYIIVSVVGSWSLVKGTPVEVPDLSNRCHLNGCLWFGSTCSGGRCLEFVLQSTR